MPIQSPCAQSTSLHVPSPRVESACNQRTRVGVACRPRARGVAAHLPAEEQPQPPKQVKLGLDTELSQAHVQSLPTVRGGVRR